LGLLSPASSVIASISNIGFIGFFVFMLSMGIALLRRRSPVNGVTQASAKHRADQCRHLLGLTDPQYAVWYSVTDGAERWLSVGYASQLGFLAFSSRRRAVFAEWACTGAPMPRNSSSWTWSAAGERQSHGPWLQRRAPWRSQLIPGHSCRNASRGNLYRAQQRRLPA
jgi:hypothetical protein